MPFQLSGKFVGEARHRRALAVPLDDDVEPVDQRVGAGPRGQQRQIPAVFLPVRAQLEQKQILDAQRLDDERPTGDFERLVDRRTFGDIPQQDSAPQVFGRRDVKPELLAVNRFQLSFQLEHGFVGKVLEVQIDILGESADTVRAQGGPSHDDDRIVDRDTERERALDQLSDNR